jgi:hypothetical protein
MRGAHMRGQCGRAYVLALLAIGARGESVFAVREDQTREVMAQQIQANNHRPITQSGKPRAQVTWREHLCPFPENEIHSAEADSWLPTRSASAPSTQSGVNTREDTHNDQDRRKPHPISTTTPPENSVHSGHRWAPSPAVVVYGGLAAAPGDLSAELAPDIASTSPLAALRHTAHTDGQVSA